MTMNKKRLGIIVGGVGAAGAVAALGLGATSALYTSEAGSQNNSITSGTIELVGNAPGSVELNETGFMPGDSKTSSYKLAYTGQQAFVGFDITITSIADKACGLADGPVSTAALAAQCTAVGTAPMFNGDTSSGAMDLMVDHVTGIGGSTLFGNSSFSGSNVSCSSTGGFVECISEKKNVILPPGYIVDPVATDLVWNNNTTVPVGVKVSLPESAGNQYQGSDVNIDLTGHAVQYANNWVLKSAGGASNTTFPNPAWQGGLQVPESWS